MYAFTYNKRKDGMISPPVKTKKELLKHKEFYKLKGWVCDVVKVEEPKPLTEDEKKQFDELSSFLGKLNRLM